MGKTGKWIKNLFAGKKDHKEIGVVKAETTNGQATPITAAQPTTPKEKRRWSFRRSSANGTGPAPSAVADHHQENDAEKHAQAVAAATAAAADAAATVIHLTAAASSRGTAVGDAAAVKIQSVFRGYLARKALNALKGLVKLQALVRGHLVRKQATATLRCMQALVTAQARARAQRLRMAAAAEEPSKKHYYNHRKSTQHQDDMEENVKIVEMDMGGDHHKPATTKSRNSFSNHHHTHRPDPIQPRISTAHRASIRQEQQQQQISPSPSAITDMSPRTCSNHFQEYSSFGTAQSSPRQAQARAAQLSYPRSEYAESLYGGGEYPFYYPSYMANTESSRAKVRSHSAPKQRPAETVERQASRRRPSLEGRSVPRAVRMQRSSSQVGPSGQSYQQYPWPVKLDRSAVSLKDSECGSTSTVATNVKYCRSLAGLDEVDISFSSY